MDGDGDERQRSPDFQSRTRIGNWIRLPRLNWSHFVAGSLLSAGRTQARPRRKRAEIG